MDIVKSSRHAKIVGDFGEALLCNWLSRSGFEVVWADHTGMDVIAFNRKEGRRLGVTVKSRTRLGGRESDPVNIFKYRKGDDRQKMLDACTAFACEPWIAIYVEAPMSADLYLLSLEHYDTHYRGRTDRKIDDWKMGRQHVRRYAQDALVKHVKASFEGSSWEW